MQLQKLKNLLNEYNIITSKRLDQYFLVDDSILQREVEYAELSKEDSVLEIGPGIGTLTEFLVGKAGSVTVIEKDAQFKPVLDKLDINIILGDALKVEWPACNKILSNLPYGISSQLTFKILEQNIDLAVLCYQKEFADRMVAQPGTSDYSRLTVNCAVRADVEVLETVPRNKYYPQPLVDSAIVKLTPKQVTLPEKFDDICRALFQHKNKKVRNALLDSYHEIGTEQEVKEFVEKIGEKAQIKVIDLKPEEIVDLSKDFK